jgi:hypothetical protein
MVEVGYNYWLGWVELGGEENIEWLVYNLVIRSSHGLHT